MQDEVRFWRPLTAVLAVLALALLVAALVRRPPPDFATRRVVAVLHDGAGRPLWVLRLAPRAHEFEATGRDPPAAAAGHVYQLWLVAGNGGGGRQIGLLPQRGDKVIPLTPENTRRLSATGRLAVTLEPLGGSQQPGPTGPILFRGSFDGTPAR